MNQLKLFAEIEYFVTRMSSTPSGLVAEVNTMCLDLLTIAAFWGVGTQHIGGKDLPITEVELIGGARFKVLIAYKDLLQALLDGGFSVGTSS